MKQSVLGIFAKEPIPGHVKTRLAAETSAGFAQRVAQAFLADTLLRFGNFDVGRMIVYAPTSARAFFESASQGDYELIPQAEGDLGNRLTQFFARARQRGFARIIAIGADSPTLPIPYVEQAFALLETNDVVIGPACDGGYYLIGGTARELPMFEGIPWSTADAFDTTITRLKETDARLATLPPWYDVDTVDDWTFLCGEILKMRRAGIDPGVPNVERLIQEASA